MSRLYRLQMRLSTKHERNRDCCWGKGQTDKDGIRILPEEIERLASIMMVSKRQFKDRWTFIGYGSEYPNQCSRRLMRYPCPFYDTHLHSCTIYTVRPLVCCAYPLGSEEEVAVSSACPEARRLATLILKVVNKFYHHLQLLTPEQRVALEREIAVLRDKANQRG